MDNPKSNLAISIFLFWVIFHDIQMDRNKEAQFQETKLSLN